MVLGSEEVIFIYLSDQQNQAGDEVGLRRHVTAEEWGCKDQREKKIPDDVSIANHRLGAKGELATALALELNNIILPWEGCILKWEGRVGNFKGADLGKKTQVRTRRGYKSEQCVRPKDKNHHFIFLVTSEDRNPRLFCVIGWISVADAKKFPFYTYNKLPPAHWVPQESHHLL